MRFFRKILLFATVIAIGHGNICLAQKKHRREEEKPTKNSAGDTVSPKYKIIDETKPQSGTLVPMYKEKVITIEKADKKKSFKDLPIIYDTIHAKPKRVLGQETIIDDRKTIVIGDKNKQVADTATREVVIENARCKCILMSMKVQDTINFEDYINYSFIFENKCKEQVWIHSGSFRFLVNDVFGHAVTRIRKIDFVKRYDYPEYVKLSPGETFEFNFADDPFFEYKMNRSQEYKFNFLYSNTGTQVKDNKKTGKKLLTNIYQCLEVRDKNVYVR